MLYVPGCRHDPVAVTKLREVLSAEGIAAEIQEIVVTDARAVEELKFPGSPTILIKRRDLAGKSAGMAILRAGACILVQEGQAFRRRR